jgi:phosphoglucan,water dikinase
MEALDLLAVSVVSVASRSNESAELDPTLRALQALGSVRAHFAAEVSSPLARGASSSDVSKRQAYRMAELSLEQTARTMLGRVEFLLGVCDSGDSGSDGSGSTGSTGGTDTFSHALTSNRSNAWGVACAAVAHAMRHVAHGGYKPAECFACANDLDALMELGGGICAPEDSKALIAALTRACRIAAQHDASLIHAYGDIPGLFAEALGVELDATVGSSKVSREVRNGSFVASLLHEGVPSSVVRLAEPMLRALSWRIAGDASKLQAHDACVVPGVCVGVMVEVDSLEFGALNTGGFGNTSRQPVVAFVRRATGDEDVSVASGGIRGIVCGSALRKLSRLAIGSARNEIPLTAASTPAGAANARGAAVAHLGEWVSLRVSPKSSLGVELRLATAGEIEDAMVAHETRDLRRMGTTGSMAQRLQVAPKLANVVRLGDLVHAKADRCGHKAQSLGDLRRIAKRPGAAFKTLPGLTLPFGTFDASLREQTGKQRALRAAVDLIEKALVTGDAKALKSACAEAYSVAKTVLPSPEIAAAICAAFIGEDPLGTGGGATGGGASNRSSTLATTTKVPLLIVRTSSLVEDPGACCGGDKGDPAGDLPSQIVSASKSRDVAGAVGRAWASQFLLSNVVRNAAAGVPIHDTTIAVVIQPLAPGTVTWEARRDDDESESSDGVSTSVSFVPGFGGWPKGAMDGEPCLVTVRHKDGVANTKQFSDVDWKNVVVMGSEVRREIAEYALESLSGTSSEAEEFRKNMARRITAVAVTLSSEFGTPQILEGCVVDDTLFVTRTRPQQPLGGK